MADKKFWDDMPLTALNDDLKLMVGDPNDSTNPKSITVGMLKAGLATLSFLRTNFFDKTQCYSIAQTDSLIQQINKLKFNVVDTLPESGEEGSIYLLKKADTTVDNYEQYFWVGDEKSYTKIGYKITDEEFEKMLSNSKTISAKLDEAQVLDLISKNPRVQMTVAIDEKMNIKGITHNMNCYPPVLVMTSNGEVVACSLQYSDKNSIIVQWEKQINGNIIIG